MRRRPRPVPPLNDYPGDATALQILGVTEVPIPPTGWIGGTGWGLWARTANDKIPGAVTQV